VGVGGKEENGRKGTKARNGGTDVERGRKGKERKTEREMGRRREISKHPNIAIYQRYHISEPSKNIPVNYQGRSRDEKKSWAQESGQSIGNFPV
jgi:hypothetical protein